MSNTNPSFNFIEESCNSYSAKGQSGWVDSVKLNIQNVSINGTGTLKRILRVGDDNNGRSYGLSDIKNIQSTDDSISLGTIDAKSIIGGTIGTTDISWRVGYKLIDGNGNSSGIDFSLYPTNTYFKIAGAPTTCTILNYKNEFDTTSNWDVASSYNNGMYQKVRFIIPKDESVSSYNVEVTKDSASVGVKEISTDIDNGNAILTVYLDEPESVSAGNINFSIKLIDSKMNKTMEPITMNHCIAPIASTSIDLRSIPTEIKPFTATASSLNISFQSAFNTSTLSSYGYVDDSSSIKLYLNRSANNSYFEKEVAAASVSDLNAIFKDNSFFLFGSNELGISNSEYVGSYEYNANLRIYNAFGDYFDIGSPVNRNFNFNELPINLSLSSIGYKNRNKFIILESNKVQEGMQLQFTGEIELYTNSTPSFSLRRGTEEIPIATISPTNFSFATNQTPVANTFQITTSSIGEITTTDNTWFLRIDTGNGGISPTLNIPVVKHTARQLNLSKCTLGPNSVEWTASVSGEGTNKIDNYSEQYELYIISPSPNVGALTSTPLSGFPSTGSSTVSGDDGVINYGSLPTEIQVVLRATTTVSSSPSDGILFSTTKSFDSPKITLYKLDPTISYRPNQVGINGAPSTDAVLEVYDNNGNKNHIYFHSTNPNAIWDFDLAAGTITFTDSNDNTHILNLSTLPST